MIKLVLQGEPLPLLDLNEHMHNKAVQPLQLPQEEYLS